MKPMTEWFDGAALKVLEKEFKTVPIDGEGHVIPVQYTEEYVRGTVLKLISDIRRLQEREKELEAEKEKWRIEAFKKYPTPDAYDAACKALNKHREQNRKLAEGLRWYADESGYVAPFDYERRIHLEAEIEKDSGERAKQTLIECGLWEDKK